MHAGWRQPLCRKYTAIDSMDKADTAAGVSESLLSLKPHKTCCLTAIPQRMFVRKQTEPYKTKKHQAIECPGAEITFLKRQPGNHRLIVLRPIALRPYLSISLPDWLVQL